MCERCVDTTREVSVRAGGPVSGTVGVHGGEDGVHSVLGVESLVGEGHKTVVLELGEAHAALSQVQPLVVQGVHARAAAVDEHEAVPHLGVDAQVGHEDAELVLLHEVLHSRGGGCFGRTLAVCGVCACVLCVCVRVCACVRELWMCFRACVDLRRRLVADALLRAHVLRVVEGADVARPKQLPADGGVVSCLFVCAVPRLALRRDQRCR